MFHRDSSQVIYNFNILQTDINKDLKRVETLGKLVASSRKVRKVFSSMIIYMKTSIFKWNNNKPHMILLWALELTNIVKPPKCFRMLSMNSIISSLFIQEPCGKSLVKCNFRRSGPRYEISEPKVSRLIEETKQWWGCYWNLKMGTVITKIVITFEFLRS